MRQLLSRMVRQSAEIHVVDFCIKEDKKKEKEIRDGKEKHWKKFFGKRKISFEFNGAENFVTNLVKDSIE